MVIAHYEERQKVQSENTPVQNNPLPSTIVGTDVRELDLKRDALWYGERIGVHVEPTI